VPAVLRRDQVIQRTEQQHHIDAPISKGQLAGVSLLDGDQPTSLKPSGRLAGLLDVQGNRVQ
jgi:hypothetical protein